MLQMHFGEHLACVADVSQIGEADAAVLLGETAADIGLADAAALDALADGRNVLCDAGVFASLFDDGVVRLSAQPSSLAADIREKPDWLRGFARGDVLEWQGRRWLTAGENFGWMLREQKLSIVIGTNDGKLPVLAREVASGLLTAMDLQCLEATGHFANTAGLIMLQALGAEVVDLGQWIWPWRGYEDYIAAVDTWAAHHGAIVQHDVLEPATPTGRQLRKLTLGEDDRKPVAVWACCTHGHEWAPAWGVFNYLRWLVDQVERGTIWGRAVAENLTLVWVPVVSVDGFHETWARGRIVPHGPRNVDLNRNYDVPDYDAYIQDNPEGRPMSPTPLSEAETQALAKELRHYAPRGLQFNDFHEAGGDDSWLHMDDTPAAHEWTACVAQQVNRRFVSLQPSMETDTPGPVVMQYREVHELGFAPTTSAYARALGYPLVATSEFSGNSELVPYRTIQRTDLVATVCEQSLGMCIGRTAYNWQAAPRDVRWSFSELDDDIELTLLRVAGETEIVEQETFTAGEGLTATLQAGERLIAIKPSMTVPDA